MPITRFLSTLTVLVITALSGVAYSSNTELAKKLLEDHPELDAQAEKETKEFESADSSSARWLPLAHLNTSSLLRSGARIRRHRERVATETARFSFFRDDNLIARYKALVSKEEESLKETQMQQNEIACKFDSVCYNRRILNGLVPASDLDEKYPNLSQLCRYFAENLDKPVACADAPWTRYHLSRR